MIGFYTKFATAPENREMLESVLSDAADAMLAVPACKIYIINRDAGDDAALSVIEVWDDAASHAASLELPGVKALIGKALPLFTEKPEQIRLMPLFGKGITE